MRILDRLSLRDSVLSAVTGVAVAGALLALDAALPTGWLFGWAPPAGGAQALLGSVTGAIITVSAVVFWVRGMFVQLSAGQLSSRVLRWYLADRFQRRMLNFLAGALAYIVTVALGVGDGSSAPTIATLVGALMAIGTLLLVVATVWDSAATTQLNEIMARITSDAVDTVRNGATYPASATVLLRVLNTLVDEVTRAGLHDRRPALRKQIAMTLEAVRRSAMMDADRERILEHGGSLGGDGAAEGDGGPGPH